MEEGRDSKVIVLSYVRGGHRVDHGGVRGCVDGTISGYVGGSNTTGVTVTTTTATGMDRRNTDTNTTTRTDRIIVLFTLLPRAP